MALNPDFIGREFPPTAPYEISRLKLAEFADAIGDPNPLYRDRAAAVAAGFPDVIAPPTFPIVIGAAASRHLMADPELGLNYAMVVHGEQRFSYARPMRAGDVIIAQATITDIKQAGRNAVLATSTRFTTSDGEHVCTAYATLVERAAEADGS